MARLLVEHPDVFDAYRAAVVGRLAEAGAGQDGNEGFAQRRERTREQRIGRAVGR